MRTIRRLRKVAKTETAMQFSDDEEDAVETLNRNELEESAASRGVGKNVKNTSALQSKDKRTNFNNHVRKLDASVDSRAQAKARKASKSGREDAAQDDDDEELVPTPPSSHNASADEDDDEVVVAKKTTRAVKPKKASAPKKKAKRAKFEEADACALNIVKTRNKLVGEIANNDLYGSDDDV